ALTSTVFPYSTLFRSGLSVNLSLVEDLPLVYGDPDAISQIIGQLLTNAYLVSPPSSEVIITARKDFMPLPSVTDAPVNCLFVSRSEEHTSELQSRENI